MRRLAYVGIGSNCQAELTLPQAARELGLLLEEICGSGVFRSASRSSGPDYLNMVVSGYADLTWRDLISALKSIEDRIGRDRTDRVLCRIDLDLLWYDGVQVENVLPHSDIWRYGYTTVPLLDACRRGGTRVPEGEPDDETIARLSSGVKPFDLKVF